MAERRIMEYCIVDVYEDDGVLFNFDALSIEEANDKDTAVKNYLQKSSYRIPSAFLLVAEYNENTETVSIPLSFFTEKLKVQNL